MLLVCAAVQLFVERFSAAQRQLLQEEKDAEERAVRLARLEAKKAAQDIARKAAASVSG